MQRDSRAWWGSAATVTSAAAAAVLVAAGHGMAAWAATAFTLLRMATQSGSIDRDVLLTRLLRPDEWFITNVGTTARELMNALPAVSRLWETDERVISRLQTRLPQLAKFG